MTGKKQKGSKRDSELQILVEQTKLAGLLSLAGLTHLSASRTWVWGAEGSGSGPWSSQELQNSEGTKGTEIGTSVRQSK